MANCFVTKLKGNVNDPNLDYFDGLIVEGISGATTKALQFNSGVVYHARVLSGTSPLPDGVTDYDFTYGFNLAGGDYKLLITSLEKMSNIKLRGSCKGSLKQVLRQNDKDSFNELFFESETLSDGIDISDINGVNLSVCIIKDRNITGNIANLSPCTKITEFQVASPNVVGSINDFAEAVYPVRDYSTFERTSIRTTFGNKISYNNGTTDILLPGGVYGVYFKSGGYEIWKLDDSTEGYPKVEKLYDSLA